MQSQLAVSASTDFNVPPYYTANFGGCLQTTVNCGNLERIESQRFSVVIWTLTNAGELETGAA
jgi:hypothetical protein